MTEPRLLMCAYHPDRPSVVPSFKDPVCAECLSWPGVTKPTPHECFLCDCTPAALGPHCEDHYEMKSIMGDRFKTCKPCPNGPPPKHYLEVDYDGSMFCRYCGPEDED